MSGAGWGGERSVCIKAWPWRWCAVMFQCERTRWRMYLVCLNPSLLPSRSSISPITPMCFCFILPDGPSAIRHAIPGYITAVATINWWWFVSGRASGILEMSSMFRQPLCSLPRSMEAWISYWSLPLCRRPVPFWNHLLLKGGTPVWVVSPPVCLSGPVTA